MQQHKNVQIRKRVNNMASFFVLETIKEGKAQKVYYNSDDLVQLIVTEDLQDTFKCLVRTRTDSVIREHTLTKSDPDILQCD